jgi:hypothetical protein
LLSSGNRKEKRRKLGTLLFLVGSVEGKKQEGF